MGPGHEGHDGGGADGDVFRAPEEDVDEASHEGGVESILRRETGNQSIGDTWRGISTDRSRS